VETIPKTGSAPVVPGDKAPSRPQNHLNGRGQSVVVVDGLGPIHGVEESSTQGEGPELGGYLRVVSSDVNAGEGSCGC
jgi:hypothetical protein